MDDDAARLVKVDTAPPRPVLRMFGGVVAAMCLARAASSWPAGHWEALLTPALAVPIAAACGALALSGLKPEVYRRPYVLLSWCTLPIRWACAVSVLAALYFVVISPLAYLMRHKRRSSGSDPRSDGWFDTVERTNKSDYFKQF